MQFKNHLLCILFSLFIILSCKKDDEELAPVANEYSEQVVNDNILLENFLKSHFYNYEDFESNLDSIVKIKIDSISGINQNKTSLYDQVKTKDISIIDANNLPVNHTLYYIIAKQGIKKNKPSIVDSVFVNYEGKLLNGFVFDQRSQPVWFDLSNVIQGFRYGLEEFSPGNYQLNSDGTVLFNDFGQGLIFMPSGLGYFSNSQTSIPAYSPLVFQVSLFTLNVTDHDSDGINSIDEDIDGNGDPMNDDSDGNSIPNLYDNDDDGDGIPTKEEYDQNNDGQPDDSDSDSIPDYLDTEG